MLKKILIIGDSPATPTGFSMVINNIFNNLSYKYEVHQLGINYYGDPHSVRWPQYPASLKGDLWGFGRLPEFVDSGFDCIFILNDVWVIERYLSELKKLYTGKKLPKIIVYFPVDSSEFDPDWFKDFDIVTHAVVYTKFGYDVVKEVMPNLELTIIPHGTNKKDFYSINEPKESLKKKMYPDSPEFYEDSFIVLNANRNQPRKRIDATIEGFSLFAKGKPENVKLHLHMGIRDAGHDVVKLSSRFGIGDRMILTNNNRTIQRVPLSTLNMIYNATDVGLNTTWGEGWGLTNTEHAVTGAVQLVPNHSSCAELFSDCGLLIPIALWSHSTDTMTKSGYVSPEGVAEGLETLYTNKKLRLELGEKGKAKFTSPMYSWSNVSKKFEELINA